MVTTMKITKYIDDKGRGAVAELARASGLSRNTVEKAYRGEDISVAAALKLSEATGGKVPAAGLAGL